MDEFLDDGIGDKFRLLPDLLKSLERERGQLQDQLSGSSSMAADRDEWQHVVSDVRKTVTELETLRDTCISLSGGSDGVEGRVELLQPDVVECARKIQPLVKETVELDHLKCYLEWVVAIHHLSARIESQLVGGSVAEAVNGYSRLRVLSSSLESSACVHLQRFASTTTLHWRQRLRTKLSGDFSSITKELTWPFTSVLSSQLPSIWSKLQKKFSELFNLLLQLDESYASVPEIPCLKDQILLPVDLLLDPLRKRFRFHFFGERKTNAKDKPEWYFTQVSAWIRDHTHFLETEIQPLLHRESSFSHVNIRLEFIRGLLQEVESKLLHDMPDIVYDDLLMSHLIDELLLFERELRTVIHYPHPHPSPLNVLMDEVPFDKWLTLEKMFAVERLSGIASSPTAWQPAYATMKEADDTMVPECPEGLMQLIAGITDRYKHLSSLDHHLRFLELQIDLLLEFHHDLANNARRASHSPLHPQFCAYLNAASYIVAILREWGEQMFFLKLHYHTVKNNPEPETSPRLDVESLQVLRQQDPEFATSEGSAFETVISVFSSLVQEVREALVEDVAASIRSKCKKVKKEKWHSMVCDKDPLTLDVTPSTADLLLSLREQLQFIADNVSSTLIPHIVEDIATRTDKILVTEVVMPSRFSEGGVIQLHYDVTKALAPLLTHFCDDITGMQLLERMQEACKLLQLLPGSAKLIQELLQVVVRGGTVDSETYSAAVNALNDMGVHTLTPNQAEMILRLKIVQSPVS